MAEEIIGQPIPDAITAPESPSDAQIKTRMAEFSGANPISSASLNTTLQAEGLEASIAQEKKADEAPIFDSDLTKPSMVSALAYSFSEYNIFGNIADWGTYREGITEDEDAQFMESLTPEYLLDTINKHDLTPDSMLRLQEAKNPQHFYRILNGEEESKLREEHISESTGATSASVMAGGMTLADPTMFVGIGSAARGGAVLAKLNKLGTKGKVVASLGTQTLISVMREEVDKRYTSDDFIIDVFVGGTIDGFLLPKQIKNATTDTFVPAGLLPYKTQSEEMALIEARNNTLLLPPPKTSTQPNSSTHNYKWKTTTERRAVQEEIKRISDAQDLELEIRAEASDLDTETYKAIAKNIVEEVASIETAIDGISDVTTSATKKIVKDIEGVIENISKISQSAGDSLLYKLNKATGTISENRRLSMKKAEEIKAGNKKSKAEKESIKKKNANFKAIGQFFNSRIAKLRQMVDEVNKLNAPAPLKKGEKPTASTVTKIDEQTAKEIKADIKNIESEMNTAIDNLENLDSPAARKLVNDIDNAIEAIGQASQSVGDKLRYKLDNALGNDYKRKNSIVSDSQSKVDKKIDEITAQKEKIKQLSGVARGNAAKKLVRLENELDNLNSKLEGARDGKRSSENRELDKTKISLGRQKEMYEMIASEIDELLYDLNVRIGAIAENGLTPKQRDVFKTNVEDVISEAFGSDIKIKIADDGTMELETPFKIEVDSNGNGYFKGKKVPLIILITMGGATVASADDGSSIVSVALAVPALILAMVIAPSLIKKIMNDGIKTAVADGFSTMKTSVQRGDKMTSPDGKATSGFIDSTVAKLRNTMTESIVEVLKNGTEESRKLARQLAYDSVDGGGTPAEVSKRHKIKTMLTRYRMNAEIEGYNNWKTRNIKDGVFNGLLEKMETSYAESEMLKQFRTSVSECVENGKCTDPDVNKTAKAFKEEIDAMVKEANEFNVHGFSDSNIAKFADNYFPHLWNKGELQNLINIADDIAPLKKAFVTMVKGADRVKPLTDADAITMVDDLFDVFTESSFGTGKSVREVDSILKSLDRLGIDVKDVSADDVISGMFDMSEVVSRAKNRILLDTSTFGSVKLMSEGKPITVSLDDIMERDSMVALERYANEVQGATQVARTTGYGSEFQLRRAILENENNEDVLEVLDYYTNVMYGKPIYSIGSTVNKNLNTIKNLSFFSVLGWVVFSMAPEVLKASVTVMKSSASRRQMFTMMKNIGNDMTQGSALYDELSTLVGGWGTSMVRQDYRFRGVDDITSVSEELASTQGFTGKASELSGKLKSATIFLSGLAKTSDMLQKLQSVGMAERLAKVVNGLENMSDGRRARYGIDEEVSLRLKERLKLKDGELQKLDFDNWSKEDQYDFRDIMERMMMNQTQEVTMGGTPMFMYNSSIGRLLMHIMSFTSASWSNHFLGGLKSMDMEEGMSTVIWFVGSYLGLQARYSAQGKDIDDETLISRALLSMPVAASLGAVNGMIDPVALSVSENVKKTVLAVTMGEE